MPGITARIAEFAASIKYEDIPHQAVAGAKDCILDCLGCMCAGFEEPVGKILVQYVRDAGGKPEASIINQDFKSSLSFAALANGTMAHALDFDDACVALPWHPTASVLPSILAIGKSRHASGKELIQAYTSGLEVGVRLGRATYPHYMEEGWHNMGTIGSIGATAAAARMLGLDVQQTLMAIGIASSEASGLRQNFGTMTKPFHAGHAAKNGVTAAILARMGMTADDAILEGEFGLCRSLGGSDESLAELCRSLGSSYELVTPGVTLKAYSSCYGTHKCIDAMLRLKKAYNFNADEIEEIQLETEPMVAQKLRYHVPTTPLQGKFSLEFCVSVAMLDGEAGLHQFTDEKVNDRAVQNMIKRVKYVHDRNPKIDQAADDPSEGVTVKLKNGKHYNSRVTAVKGHPQNPMSREEIKAKYRQCASSVLSPEQIERTYKMISNLEALDDVNKLLELFQPR